MSIGTSVETLRRDIEKASKNAALASGRVTLLAASKGRPAALIEEALAAGISDFGENRVQEAQEKWLQLKKRHDVTLHLIGPLQTNKVKEALALFNVIQTLDRPKLAEAIAGVMRCRSDGVMEKGTPSLHHPITPLRLYIQINTGEEPQKAGVLPKDADELIGYCVSQLKLPVTGLMCIPPHDMPPAPHFAFLRELARRHGLQELSMGMSEDFETAVRMGSTCVRIGRRIFGERSAEMQKK